MKVTVLLLEISRVSHELVWFQEHRRIHSKFIEHDRFKEKQEAVGVEV